MAVDVDPGRVAVKRSWDRPVQWSVLLLTAALFVYAPGSQVLGSTMIELWRQGNSGPVAALGLVQLAMTLVVVSSSFRFGAVKPYESEQARAWLREMQQRSGITTVYVTHDQDEALAMSDFVAVMHHGRLCQYGPPTDVYEKPASRFVADFLGATAFLEGLVCENRSGHILVRLRDGHLLAVDTSNTWIPGTAVTLAVRSERAQIFRSRSEAPLNNIIAARIVRSTCLGARWQHLAESAAGSLKVESLEAVPAGEVTLHLPANAIIPLPEEGSAA